MSAVVVQYGKLYTVLWPATVWNQDAPDILNVKLFTLDPGAPFVLISRCEGFWNNGRETYKILVNGKLGFIDVPNQGHFKEIRNHK